VKTSRILQLLAVFVLVFSMACNGEDTVEKIIKKRAARNWYVDVNAFGTGTGKSWLNAFNDIQPALDAASSGDRIFVAEGVYTEPSGFPPGFPTNPVVHMKKGVKIFGGFAGTEGKLSQRGDPSLRPTVLDGQLFAYHVIIGASDARLDGFLVQYGYADGSYGNSFGAGMFNDGVAGLEIENCEFSYNYAYSSGGGMLNYNSSLTISNTIFSDNFADAGGGMFNLYSNPDIDDAAFVSNIAFASDNYHLGGGGMYNYYSSPTVSATDFVYNFCYRTITYTPPLFGRGAGAGMFSRSYSYPDISDSLFFMNDSLAGSGIFNGMYSAPAVTDTILAYNYGFIGAGMFNGIYSSPVIDNALIIGNVAYDNVYGPGPGPGGGMANVFGSSPIIYNATFSNNYGGWGGAIFNYEASNPVISNSILWNDIGTSGNDELNNAEVGAPCNPVVTYSDIDENGFAGINGNIRNDPLFVGNYYLSQIAAGQGADSPAVDAGNDTAANLGMDDKTTRTDAIRDTGIVDMGFHYPIP